MFRITENALFDVVHAVVVLVQYMSGGLKVQPLLAIAAVRQTGQPVHVVAGYAAETGPR